MKDSGETIVGLLGVVSFAPFGTPLPDDIAAPLDAGFSDVGFIDVPGASFEDVPDKKEHGAWGASGPIRSWNAQRKASVEFALEQVNADNMVAAFGGGAWTTTATGVRYDPPSARELNELSICIDIADGVKSYRIVVYRAIGTPPKMEFSDQDITLMPLHFDALLNAETERAWYWLDNTTQLGGSGS